MKLEWDVEASNEFAAQLDWYRERSPRTALRFLNAVDAVVERIRKKPLQFPVFDALVHRAIVSSFPFVVLFTSEEHLIRIRAVAHTSRRPGYWRESSAD